MTVGIDNKSEPSSVPSSIALFVALYLILLAFFIILTKDLSFDKYKQTVAMHSLYKTFGRPKTQEVYFGVTEEGKIDAYHAEMEEIFKGKAEIILSSDGNKFTLKMKKNDVYFADEVDFKPEIFDKIVEFRDVVRRWDERDQPNFTIAMSADNYQADKERLQYFQNRFGNIEFKIGLNLDDENIFVFTAENTETAR